MVQQMACRGCCSQYDRRICWSHYPYRTQSNSVVESYFPESCLYTLPGHKPIKPGIIVIPTVSPELPLLLLLLLLAVLLLQLSRPPFIVAAADCRRPTVAAVDRSRVLAGWLQGRWCWLPSRNVTDDGPYNTIHDISTLRLMHDSSIIPWWRTCLHYNHPRLRYYTNLIFQHLYHQVLCHVVVFHSNKLVLFFFNSIFRFRVVATEQHAFPTNTICICTV